MDLQNIQDHAEGDYRESWTPLFEVQEAMEDELKKITLAEVVDDTRKEILAEKPQV